MKKRAVASFLLLLVSVGLVFPAPVEVPATVRMQPGRLLKIEAGGSSKVIKWVNCHDGIDVIPSETGRWAIVSSPYPGKYKIGAYGSDVTGAPSDAVYVVVVVEGTPAPTPTPTPTPPTPPTPTPTPPLPPAPIPVTGLRVLVVEESMDRAKLPPAQAAIIFDARVRQYLNTKCAVGPDGRTREWNFFDQNVYMGDAPKHWQDAMKRPRDSLPWLIISDGVKGYEGPLPPTVEETMTLLKKYGG